jgi:hypothetical protein
MARVTTLTQGVLRAMLLSKIKAAAVLLLTAAGLGAGLWFCGTQAAEPPKPPTREAGETPPGNKGLGARADVSPEEPAPTTVVLRAGQHLKAAHVQNIIEGLQSARDPRLKVVLKDAGPTAELSAMLRGTSQIPPRTIAKAVEVLLDNGVRQISIGEAPKSGEEANPGVAPPASRTMSAQEQAGRSVKPDAAKADEGKLFITTADKRVQVRIVFKDAEYRIVAGRVSYDEGCKQIIAEREGEDRVLMSVDRHGGQVSERIECDRLIFNRQSRRVDVVGLDQKK